MQRLIFLISQHAAKISALAIGFSVVGLISVVFVAAQRGDPQQAGLATGGAKASGGAVTQDVVTGGSGNGSSSKPSSGKTDAKKSSGNGSNSGSSKSTATAQATTGGSATAASDGAATAGGTAAGGTTSGGTQSGGGTTGGGGVTGPTCTDPSGECLPAATLTGWTRIFADNFTVNAATGSWGTTDSHAVVYTGDLGGKWAVYPDGWSSTYTNGQPGYYPSQVLSVHDGTLDFYLHPYNGNPAGANPTPLVGGTTPMRTYGRYTARLKLAYDDATKMSAYHMAWLLWPSSDSNYKYAESDFPEMHLDSTQACAYAHYGGAGAQDIYCKAVDLTQWHTYTQEWGIGYRKYYIDDVLVGTSTNQVWSQTERWQLQTEPSGVSNTGTGHLLVDWVAVYAPAS